MTTKTKATTMERYTTTAGEVIEYPRPAPEVAAYLARVMKAAHDPRVSEGELIELVYSKDNPLLDATVMPGRGAVTKAVLADPVYHVILDLLFAKRVQVEATARAAASSGATMRDGLSVADAAKQLGMSESAVRQAIARGDLEATKVRGAHSINPASVESYRERVTRRGPTAEPALRIRMGNEPGHSFRVKVHTTDGSTLELGEREKLESGGYVLPASVAHFDRAVVSFSGEKVHRLFLIAASDESDSFDFGPFGIAGHYKLIAKINDPENAADAWKVVGSDGVAIWGVEVEDDELDRETVWLSGATEQAAIERAVEMGHQPTGRVEIGFAVRREPAFRTFHEHDPVTVIAPGRHHARSGYVVGWHSDGRVQVALHGGFDRGTSGVTHILVRPDEIKRQLVASDE
ncbi:MAG: helix-turn-helix domain-containing protein [Sandaracinaceae bacterium]